ncbi:hypothetical protein [Rubripirellula reticaptiva]|uniref:Uncharacterized protein n=1 Tax=Rubripirellula reticaptiva TaxID=2528013 RepID=A0A5C6F9A3_9BACT|nr:hypothetical protein [Rubripirellula reticaptiva]TWU58323.1 hypothetical protein Poly59_12340 [Rubripirellula reticaptiva]
MKISNVNFFNSAWSSPFSTPPVRWAASLLVMAAMASTAPAAEKDVAEKDGDKKTSNSTKQIDDDLGFAAERDALPKVVNGRFVIPPLAARSTDFADVGNGKTPDGFRAAEDRPLQLLPESGADRGGDWAWSLADWAAPNTYSYPRYFEDRMLERHGHERFGYAQPLASGVRFFATMPMLPYLMAIQHPCDCEYTLGYYRPGSCAPRTLQRPPWDRRAVIAETAAVAVGIIAIP